MSEDVKRDRLRKLIETHAPIDLDPDEYKKYMESMFNDSLKYLEHMKITNPERYRRMKRTIEKYKED